MRSGSDYALSIAARAGPAQIVAILAGNPEEAGIFRHAAPVVTLAIAALLACSGSAESAGSALPVPDLFVMNADGSGQVSITNSPGWESSPDWSPNGKKIAYSRDEHIVVANADGSNPLVLTQPGSGYNRHPAWSPNGRKIAFSSGSFSGGITFDIFVMNADGSHQVNLTRRSAADEFGPSWSPDGKKIAFSSGGRNEDAEICVMRSNGTDPRRLTNNSLPDGGAAWSPNGATIAFDRAYRASAELFASDIWVMTANGRRKTVLTRGLESDFQPAWSPDGKRIAFARGLNIWVMDADGRGLVHLGDNQTNDTDPDWSADEKKIVFQRGQAGSFPSPPDEGERDPVTPCKLPPPWRCHVPKVVGLRLALAKIWIRDAECTVGRVRRVRSKRVGRVISQSPRSGAVRARGGKINLVVGRRAAPS